MSDIIFLFRYQHVKENFEIFIKSNTLALCAGCMHDTSCFVNQNAVRAVRILAHYGQLLREQKALYPTMSQSKWIFKIFYWIFIILPWSFSLLKWNFQCLDRLSVRNSWDGWPILGLTRLTIEWSISSGVFRPRSSMKKRPFPKCGNTKICHYSWLKMAQSPSNTPSRCTASMILSLEDLSHLDLKTSSYFTRDPPSRYVYITQMSWGNLLQFHIPEFPGNHSCILFKTICASNKFLFISNFMLFQSHFAAFSALDILKFIHFLKKKLYPWNSSSV